MYLSFMVVQVVANVLCTCGTLYEFALNRGNVYILQPIENMLFVLSVTAPPIKIRLYVVCLICNRPPHQNSFIAYAVDISHRNAPKLT